MYLLDNIPNGFSKIMFGPVVFWLGDNSSDFQNQLQYPKNNYTVKNFSAIRKWFNIRLLVRLDGR